MSKADTLLAWTLTLAAKEFGRDREVLRKRLAEAGVKPSSDGKYTTREIVGAVFGDKHSVELEIANEKKRKLELENNQTEGELVTAAFFELKLENLLVTLRQKILGFTELTDEQKNDLLADLKTSND